MLCCFEGGTVWRGCVVVEMYSVVYVLSRYWKVQCRLSGMSLLGGIVSKCCVVVGRYSV